MGPGAAREGGTHSLSEDGWQLIIPNLPLDPVFGFQRELKL